MYNVDLSALPGDFVVEYEINLSPELKQAKPHQGMRTDFLYEGDDPVIDGIHMIWPELLDAKGNSIEDKTPGSAPLKGLALMWIVRDEAKPYHAGRLKLGTKGHWVRGPFKVADVKVIKIGKLKEETQ